MADPLMPGLTLFNMLTIISGRLSGSDVRDNQISSGCNIGISAHLTRDTIGKRSVGTTSEPGQEHPKDVVLLTTLPCFNPRYVQGRPSIQGPFYV